MFLFFFFFFLPLILPLTASSNRQITSLYEPAPRVSSSGDDISSLKLLLPAAMPSEQEHDNDNINAKKSPQLNPESRPRATDFAERAFHSPSISTTNSSSSFTSGSEVDGDNDFISRVQTAQTQTQQGLGVGGLQPNITAMSRIATYRSQQSGTVGAGPSHRRPSGPLPEFGGGKAFPPPLPERDEYVVEFTGADDPIHPQNWSIKKK